MNVTAPLAIIAGAILYFSSKNYPKFPLLVAIIFGASISSFVLTLVNSLLQAVQK